MNKTDAEIQAELWGKVAVAYIRSRGKFEDTPAFKAIEAADKVLDAFHKRFCTPPHQTGFKV